MNKSGEMKSFFGLKEKAGGAVRLPGAVCEAVLEVEASYRRALYCVLQLSAKCGCSRLVAEYAYQRCKALLLASLLRHPVLRL